MIITTEIAEKRFAHFNRLLFKGKLAPVPILLSRARTKIGMCCYMRTGRPPRTTYSDFRLKFSTAFNLKPRQWDDIIIHEMIHYYILSNGYHDTSSHGVIFKQIMNNINTTYHRNVTISHKTEIIAPTDDADPSVFSSPAVKHRYRFVAIVTGTDGRRGFKVLPAVYKSIVKYCTSVEHAPNVAKVELYQSCNDYFGHYPSSAALHIYWFKDDDYEKLMAGAVPMVIEAHSIHAAEKH